MKSNSYLPIYHLRLFLFPLSLMPTSLFLLLPIADNKYILSVHYGASPRNTEDNVIKIWKHKSVGEYGNYISNNLFEFALHQMVPCLRKKNRKQNFVCQLCLITMWSNGTAILIISSNFPKFKWYLTRTPKLQRTLKIDSVMLCKIINLNNNSLQNFISKRNYLI